MEKNSPNSAQELSKMAMKSFLSEGSTKQPIFKVVLIFLSFLLCIISGGIASIIGGTIFINIFLPTETLSWIQFLISGLVTIIWIVVTLNQGISRGLSITAILLLFIIALFAMIAGFETFNKTTTIFSNLALFLLPATLIFLSFSTISFLLGAYGVSLFYYLFSSQSKFYKYFGYSIIILSTAITAHLSVFNGIVNNHRLEKTIVNSGEELRLKWIIVVGSFLFSIGIEIFSILVTNSRSENHFIFLRNWAIALSSWGSTSFYNLDLSNVNFKNVHLANTDLRAKKLYRTCFQGSKGLERARVDSRYLDLENQKVQKLLTRGYSEEKDFSHLNLCGAYLQNADLRGFNFKDADLSGADLRGADLHDSIMACTKVIDVDFTGADLTGACIQDWSVNSQTDFTDVKCDYVYRKLNEKGERSDRFPTNRNFEPREFESLYQEVENVVELIFKEGDNWQAALFSLKKLQIEDEELGLQLKGIERRGDRWVVKVTYNQNYSKQEVERVLDATVEEMKHQLAAKERQINRLLGIMEDQAEALNRLSRQPFGNSFVITGSTITNLVGSGQIDYDEASNKIRSIVTNGSDPTQVATGIQTLLEQFQGHGVATTPEHQAELIQQLILAEAQKNPEILQLFVEQGRQIADALPQGAIATAIKKAIAQLT